MCVPPQPGISRAIRAAAVHHSMQQQVCVECVCVVDSTCLSGAVRARPRVHCASQRACIARASVRSRPRHRTAAPQLQLWQQQQQ